MPKIVYVEEIHLNGEVLQTNGIHATRIEIVWISVHFDATKNIEKDFTEKKVANLSRLLYFGLTLCFHAILGLNQSDTFGDRPTQQDVS